MNEEQKLLNQIRAGNGDAFSDLVESLLSSAYRTAYLILGSRELAEDAVQIALEDCYLSIMRDMEIRHFKAWFYRLVYTRSIDVYRKQKRNQFSDIDENPEAISRLKTDSAQEKAVEKETKQELLHLITTLKDEQRVPLLLFYFENLSVKEISLILSENTNTVKTRLARGRKKLGELMKKDQHFQMEEKSYGI
ncbi:RNA polymerase sigma factor [Bacillus sp. ISL-35]|uniref:RNA polymerase sigma factor n=1 Tax=Bacillus sp. ISL-35 TaxID=2819122 RepID=UPI001BE7BF40|nr:RNA polymerase sigma factor [Bacillus sp. ISL-35]MBT2681745.1 RNA polymerase sigma factor [Bacillus sp. ISL-35]MBT2706042.1 RNA polymerase sigma factor [Chryseobacterium sp. ISL-80]